MLQWHYTCLRAAQCIASACMCCARAAPKRGGKLICLWLLLQDAGAVSALVLCLTPQQPLAVQAMALRALDNLCKISRPRQEAAALAGAVPCLVSLVQAAASPRQPPAQPPSPAGAEAFPA